MNVLICSENHFVLVGDEVHFPLTSPNFFQRYRTAWEEVIILARARQAPRPPQGSVPLEMTGVRLACLPDFYGPQQYLRSWLACRNIARQWLPQAHSILFRAPGTISNIAWKQIRGTGRPFGVEVVGDPARSLARGSARHLFLPLLRNLAVKALAGECREAYSTAYVTERTLQQFYPPAVGRFTTNYSSIELHQRQLAQTPRANFPAQGPYKIVSVGSFATLYKAQDVILKALAQAVRRGLDVHATLIGEGKYRPEMEQLARDLQLADRVKFLGELPMGDAVLAELDKADLFVLPSRQEGLPRATIEAMARGLPCLGSTVGGTPELLSADEMVSPDDVNALSQKMQAILTDPARMVRLSQCNLQTASQYTENVLSARRTNFYRHLRSGTEAWMNRR